MREEQHEYAGVFIFKSVANNFPSRHGQAPLPKLAAWLGGELVVQWFAKTDWGENGVHQNRFNGIELRQHFAVGVRILFGKFRKFSAGAIEIAPLRQITAVRKWNVKDGIRVDVL